MRPRRSPRGDVAAEEKQGQSPAMLCALALFGGLLAGFAAVMFRALIALVHNLLFLGEWSLIYDSGQFTPVSPWGPFVILVPVLGAMGVTFIVSKYAPEAIGSGVPQLLDAIHHQAGVIRPVVALAKGVASALAIGSGAALGREGPVILVGSALASTIGQLVVMPTHQRIGLVAAGAAAGIAATFDTPIGGVLFVVELMLPEVRVNALPLVAISTGAATFTGRAFFGAQPIFDLTAARSPLPADLDGTLILLFCLTLGAVAGISAAIFIRGLRLVSRIFGGIADHYVRHAIGMLLLGVLLYGLMRSTGHYYVEVVGYATVQAILAGQISAAWLLLALHLCKLAATWLSLGSGSSGGIFAPMLFLGATLGGAFANVLSACAPALPISLPLFAMAGMGAMVGSVTGAPLAAVAMVLEMTHDDEIVLPVISAVAVATFVRRLLSHESVYTTGLVLVRQQHQGINPAADYDAASRRGIR